MFHLGCYCQESRLLLLTYKLHLSTLGKTYCTLLNIGIICTGVEITNGPLNSTMTHLHWSESAVPMMAINWDEIN